MLLPLIPEPLTVSQGILCFCPRRGKYRFLIRHLESKTLTERLKNFLKTVRDRFGLLIEFALHLGHDFSGTTKDLPPGDSFFVRSNVAPDLPCFIRNLRVTFQGNPNGLLLLLHMRLETLRIIYQQGLRVPWLYFSHPAIE